MPRFFVERIEDPVILPPREARHAVRVLRLGPGDPVIVFDGREAWRGEIESTRGRVTVRLRERLPPVTLPAVTVAAAVPKGSRLDWMIEKLAELGVSEFVPVRFARSVASLGEGRRRRLEKIALAAAKQSGAPLLRVAPERPVEEIPSDWWLASPGAEAPLPGGRGGAVVVGPEGGLTPEEEARFARKGSLGPTTLRIETAAVVAAARLLGP
jgi:16S rRNA (uracil1498-N3)-methyltransferase